MIHVNNLQFQYPKADSPTLKGISFDIKQGELFGFLGPSGAGKSTTQKVLFKTLVNYTGDVKIDGKDLKSWDISYYEKIGVGFELPNHYQKLTGLENLDLFGSFYPNGQKKDKSELFEMVGLEDAINKPVEAYSKGMKVRLNFIRAIQHDPDILFFDEPTAGLDPVNSQMIRRHIQDLQKKGKTIFITTHSMHTADELCNRVAFIVDGELRITDSPESLKSKYGKEAVLVELKNGQSQKFSIQDLGHNKEFLEFIKADDVQRIHTMEATLDEVFINVTGKALDK